MLYEKLRAGSTNSASRKTVRRRSTNRSRRYMAVDVTAENIWAIFQPTDQYQLKQRVKVTHLVTAGNRPMRPFKAYCTLGTVKSFGHLLDEDADYVGLEFGDGRSGVIAARDTSARVLVEASE